MYKYVVLVAQDNKLSHCTPTRLVYRHLVMLPMTSVVVLVKSAWLPRVLGTDRGKVIHRRNANPCMDCIPVETSKIPTQHK